MPPSLPCYTWIQINGKSAKSNKKKNANAVDWKSLEKQQEEEASGSEDGSDDDEDSDDEGSEEGGGISLDGNLEHVVEDYTFEFNDMREEYSEGICTMLRKFIANPTEAYNLATVITAQSKETGLIGVWCALYSDFPLPDLLLLLQLLLALW